MAASIVDMIGDVGMSILGQQGNRGVRPNDGRGPDAQIMMLAQEVTQEMSKYERRLFLEADQSNCFALYGHWFLTILAIFETGARLMLHCMIAFFYFVTFYIVKCLSCGKVGFLRSYESFGQFHMRMTALYLGLLCVIPNNLCVPWNPPFYVFKRGPRLIRPPGAAAGADLGELLRNGCCAMCCASCLPSLPLDPAHSLRFLLVSYGGGWAHRACLWGDASPATCLGCGAAYSVYLQRLRDEMQREADEDTRRFYSQSYSVESFDELVARRLQAQAPIPAQYAPSAQYVPSAQYTPSAPPQYHQHPGQGPPHYPAPAAVYTPPVVVAYPVGPSHV